MTPPWLSKNWRTRYARLLREMQWLEKLARRGNQDKAGGNRPERLTANGATHREAGNG